MDNELHVFLNEERIGTLTQENGAMSFAYVPEYQHAPAAYPLSQNLPLQETTFHDPDVENFFSNLLPDERIRLTVASVLLVSPENTFGLLKHIGADLRKPSRFIRPDRRLNPNRNLCTASSPRRKHPAS